MNRFKLAAILLFFLIYGVDVTAQGFSLAFSDSYKSFTIDHPMLQVKSDWKNPDIQPQVTGNAWQHIAGNEGYKSLTGLSGSLRSDVFTNGGIQVERQIWLSSDKSVLAVRQILTNNTESPIRVERMVLISCSGIEAFVLKKNPKPENWVVNIQKRFKSDFPESLRPVASTTVNADPVLSVTLQVDVSGQILLIGYLDWLKHLTNLEMIFLQGKRDRVLLDRSDSV